jgi:squalene-associated FAD-dependent desaturase
MRGFGRITFRLPYGLLPRVTVIGGGLAGLAAAAALADAGCSVDVYEAKPFFGGRATSYPIDGEVIDNCQHILLRCCVNLRDFYRRLSVGGEIEFHQKFYFIEPGGRVSPLERGGLPAPIHFSQSFARAKWLNLPEKISLGRALLALRRERRTRQDLDRITMQQWLEEKRQPPRVIERFWRQVLVSAINEELDQMAASHGFQVFWLGFLATRYGYEMGIPKVPLGELYAASAWKHFPKVSLHERATVEAIAPGEITVNGERKPTEQCVVALPFERLRALLPELPVAWDAFSHSPITGIHLWFDRPVTELPHGTLLDRTIQWFYNKDGGRYLQLVVSASRSLTPMGRQEVIDLAVRELAEFLPAVREAKLEKAHVVKEVRATFSARPGLEALRPEPEVAGWPGLYLAGDWTRSGWPATMEGAVRSGYRAAEAVLRNAGAPRRYLQPDIA